jgi:PBSX family phage terminase large subunit
MSKSFRQTEKQIEASKTLAGPETHCMLFGGSRSGKTFKLIRSIIIRASKVKSRHVVLRLKFNHVKTSIWLDTLPKVLNICFPHLPVNFNKSDYYITLPSGSEVWFAGLDDAARVEKILGKEYSTLYFNECSQIPYKSVVTALTRLAEKNSLKKKAYYDMNPPSKKHWSYWLFIKGLDPTENIPLDKNDYSSFLMNPEDNLENIDENYLKMLEKLPEKERRRFMLGEFVEDSDGLVYYSFDRDMHVGQTQEYYGTRFIGMDFNVQPMTAIVCQMIDGIMHVQDEFFLENSDTYKMSKEILKHDKYKGARVIPDSTGRNRKTSGKSDFIILEDYGFTIESTRNPIVFDRTNNINRLFTSNKIIINPRCKKLINDLERVTWKDGGIDKRTDPMLSHVSDSLGYAAWKLMPIQDEDTSLGIILE